MSSASKITLSARHHERLHINMSSRCMRIAFNSIPLDPGARVSLTWMYCYDGDEEHPNWREVVGAEAEAPVKLGGRADFFLIFGPVNKECAAVMPTWQSTLVLTRPDPQDVDVATAPTLPLLSYVVKEVRKDENGQTASDAVMFSGRVQLHALWGNAVFNEAVDVFNVHVNSCVGEFLERDRLNAILKAEWNRLFMHIRKTHEFAKDKRPEEEVGLDDDVTLVKTTVPLLSDELIERMLRVVVGTDCTPPLISRRAFCGPSPREGVSMWRLMQNYAELVGRSSFLRQLYNAGQLYMLGSQETFEVLTCKLRQFDVPNVYFFRVPRTALQEAALILELFDVVKDEASDVIALKAVRPTTYVTVSQLARADGNPFVAFANLESAHHEKLAKLDLRGMLQPPTIRIKRYTDDTAFDAKSLDISVYRIDDKFTDFGWWSCGSKCD